MPSTSLTGSPRAHAPPRRPTTLDSSVDQCVRDLLGRSPYAYYFNQVRWDYAQGRLTLHGDVPTYYLKQVLQSLLRDVPKVRQIVNHVQVRNASGLCRD